MTPVQLRLDPVLPIDPEAAAKLTAPARRRLYDALHLDLLQRQAAEEAVRLVIRRQYGKGRR